MDIEEKYDWAVCNRSVSGNNLNDIKLVAENRDGTTINLIAILHVVNSRHDTNNCGWCRPTMAEMRQRMIAICSHKYVPEIIEKQVSMVEIQQIKGYGERFRICADCENAINGNRRLSG
jgi:hypothetical protein